jgi:hypothetical protein
VSRYFTRPLLDLADIGVYIIGLRAEITPTPRLQHMGLCNEAGMLPVPDTRSLLAQAAAGVLTTCIDDATVALCLSVHGYARLGLSAPIIDQPLHTTMRLDGSPHGSADGSSDTAAELSRIVGQEAIHRVANTPAPLIAWDVGMIHESTNHDSTTDRLRAGGGSSHGGGDRQAVTHALSEPDVLASADHPVEPPLCDLIPAALDAEVVAGHRLLNPARLLRAGEWLELLALQTAHGAGQILIWQTRAGRSAVERPFGVTPTYYQACAARAASAADRPCAAPESAATARRDRPASKPFTAPVCDPACEALLQAMGVREWKRLGAVPHTLIAAWAEVITHPGLVVRFDSPIGFAVRQMRQGQAPPPHTELERWAERMRRTTDRYDAWRYIEHSTAGVNRTADERQLEARVRAIAPPDADLADLCELARAIEAGATDTEALAQFQNNRVAGAG